MRPSFKVEKLHPMYALSYNLLVIGIILIANTCNDILLGVTLFYCLALISLLK